ncbi:cell division protein FtsL [Eionea flava]
MKSLSHIEKKKAFRQQMLWVCVLWLAVLSSALIVIYSSFDTRNQFNALEVLRSERNALQVEWGKYLLEESAWASFERIEKTAVDTLGMQIPVGQQLVVVAVDE